MKELLCQKSGEKLRTQTFALGNPTSIVHTGHLTVCRRTLDGQFPDENNI